MKTLDRFTLAAVTTAAVLAAFAAATTLNTPTPLLTWACAYTASTLGFARLAGLPPARTLWAATLLVAAALHVLLTGIRYALDGLTTALAHLATVGTSLLATTPQKAA